MNATPTDTVRALVELSKAMPNGTDWLRDVRDHLSREVKAEEGVLTVTLTTPTGNAGPLADAVASLLKKKTGRGVAVRERANAELVGGAILQFGDQQIDLSVRGALESLETGIRSSAML